MAKPGLEMALSAFFSDDVNDPSSWSGAWSPLALRKLFSFRGELYAIMCMPEDVRLGYTIDQFVATEEDDGSPHLARQSAITGLWERVASLAAPGAPFLDAFVMDGKLFFFVHSLFDGPHGELEWDSYDFETGALASVCMSRDARAVHPWDTEVNPNRGCLPSYGVLHALVVNDMPYRSMINSVRF